MIGAIAAGAILGAIIGFWVLKKMAKGEVDSAKKYKEKTINEAHRKAKTIKKEAMLRAKDSLYRMKLDFEKETKEKKEQLLALERRLFHKEENLDKKIEQYEQREKAIAKREKDAAGIEEALRRNQTEYERLIADPGVVEAELRKGAEKARARSAPFLAEIRAKIGIRRLG